MSTKYKLNVVDFTKFPGPRFKKLGPGSGEEFRDDYLIPAIKEHGSNIDLNLDGAAGYGSSFLEEAFGGAVRLKVSPEILLEILKDVQCDDEPTLKEEIIGYVSDAKNSADTAKQ
jgi:hypothetical protein